MKTKQHCKLGKGKQFGKYRKGVYILHVCSAKSMHTVHMYTHTCSTACCVSFVLHVCTYVVHVVCIVPKVCVCVAHTHTFDCPKCARREKKYLRTGYMWYMYVHTVLYMCTYSTVHVYIHTYIHTYMYHICMYMYAYCKDKV
jgi:hypothetical protein